MPVIQKELSLPISGTIENMASGSAFEYARGRQLLSMGVTAAATGSAITINSGGDVVCEESPPIILTTFPVVPDQMIYNDVMEMFDRLRVFVRNNTAGAIVHRMLALLTQV